MKKTIEQIKKWWKMAGPGITTGAADDDPSGIATYSQTGSQFGFIFLWLAPYSFVLMGIVQEMCARIALVTGRGLAENIRIHFKSSWLYVCGFLVITANTLNIGADLGAMASTVTMFFPQMSFVIPLLFFALVIVLLEIYVSYTTYAKYLKWLSLSLLTYIVTGLVLNFDFSVLLSNTFIPHLTLNKDTFIIVAAILGTTISPYLFFWQTSQEVEDEISKGDITLNSRLAEGPQNIKQMRYDVWGGMLFSNIVMFFIIAVCAETLHKAGITHIESASEAAFALKPLVGNFAYILFAFGILSTGLLAIPVLAASSAYIFAETFKLNEGLYRKFREARGFYLTITFSILVGFLFNFFGVNPIQSLIYSSVFNALVAPLALVFIMLLSQNKDVMGVYKNGVVGNILGWITTVLMFVVAVITLYYIL